MRGREINIKGLTEKEIGYIIGIFKGDGYTYHDKKYRHYSVDFFLNSNKDLDIIKFLCSVIKKIRLKPLIYKDKRFNSIRVRINSREFYNFIKKFDNKLNSKEFKIGFISGFIDAEGYVNPKKSSIEINNTNKEVMHLIKLYFKEFDLKANLNKRSKSIKDKLPSYRLYVPINFIKIDNNSLKIQRYKKYSFNNSGVEHEF